MKKVIVGFMIILLCSCNGSTNKKNDYNYPNYNSSATTITTSIERNNVSTIESNNITKNRAYISSQPFIKEILTFPEEADFDSNVVFETQANGKYTVLGKVITKNAFGVKSNYTYKIWLDFKGTDWLEQSNWSYSKIILENSNTKEQQTFRGTHSKPKNDMSRRVLGEIDGIKCTTIEQNDNAIRIITSKKFTESQMHKAAKQFKLDDVMMYFHLPKQTERGEEYGFKVKDLAALYDQPL